MTSYLCAMRTLSLILVSCLFPTIVSAAEMPRQMRGVWASSPTACDLYRRSRENVPKDASVVIIGADRVAGSTVGKLIRAASSRSVITTDESNPNTEVDFTLRKNGFLEETVVGARASALYVRCPGVR